MLFMPVNDYVCVFDSDGEKRYIEKKIHRQKAAETESRRQRQIPNLPANLTWNLFSGLRIWT